MREQKEMINESSEVLTDYKKCFVPIYLYSICFSTIPFLVASHSDEKSDGIVLSHSHPRTRVVNNGIDTRFPLLFPELNQNF